MLVLIAEDDTHTRRGLVEVLQGEGFVTLQASDGEQAWNKYTTHRPDFLCLDVMMPRINGYELCKRIRREDVATPIIFLTAKGEEVDKVVGLEIGADDYIVKPFSIIEVLARIRAVARRCLSNDASLSIRNQTFQDFEMFDLTILPTQLRARRGEQSIDLSLRDIKILHQLATHPNEVVPRCFLMQAAWGQEYFSNSRTLDQHIAQLRKRVELDPKDPQIIKTVHGVGYRYDVVRSKTLQP